MKTIYERYQHFTVEDNFITLKFEFSLKSKNFLNMLLVIFFSKCGIVHAQCLSVLCINPNRVMTAKWVEGLMQHIVVVPNAIWLD